MNDRTFSQNTLTDNQATAIIKLYHFVFPDLRGDGEHIYIQRKAFIDDNNVLHNALFIYGNLIFFDDRRNSFVIRRIADGFNEMGELYMEEDSIHPDINGVMNRIIQRQVECRIKIFFSNETNEEGKEIPFSSRYECAIRGKAHKEYDQIEEE